MSWQFGGNFDPVLSACNHDWLNCLLATVHYIWFEIVTDVVDCLTNETILWRILSIILTCTMIIYVIYWQIRWMRVIKQNKNNLKNVNCHVKDLQLKINVLTYKAQYGTWPLPNSAKKKIRNKPHSAQCLFSIQKKKNDLTTNFLSSDQSQASVSNTNKINEKTKYVPSTSEDEQLAELDYINDEKSPTNLLEKNIESSNRLSNFSTRIKGDLDRSKLLKNYENTIINQNFQTASVESSPMAGVNRQGTLLKLAKKTKNELKDSSSAATIVLASNSCEEIEEQSSDLSSRNFKVFSKTDCTLNKIKKKLENIYSTLRYYRSKDSKLSDYTSWQNSNILSDNSQVNFCNQFEDNSLYKLENVQNDCHYNSLMSQDVPKHDQIINSKDVLTEFERLQIINKDYSFFENTIETQQDEVQLKNENSTYFLENTPYMVNKEKTSMERTENISDEECQRLPDNYFLSVDLRNLCEKLYLKDTPIKTDFNKTSETGLIQEVLQFEKKHGLKVQTEIQQFKSFQNVEIFDISSIEQNFQANKLDMITEESSMSTSDRSRDQIFESFENEEEIIESVNDEKFSHKNKIHNSVSNCNSVENNLNIQAKIFQIENLDSKNSENSVNSSNKSSEDSKSAGNFNTSTESLSDSNVNKLIESEKESSKIISNVNSDTDIANFSTNSTNSIDALKHEDLKNERSTDCHYRHYEKNQRPKNNLTQSNCSENVRKEPIWKEGGDSQNNDELFLPRKQNKEKTPIYKQNEADATSWSLVDLNPSKLESYKFFENTDNVKNNIFYSSSKLSSNLPLRAPKPTVKFFTKLSSADVIKKKLRKNNLDAGNRRHWKSKSNLRFAEKARRVNTHKRSKFYAISRDNSFGTKNHQDNLKNMRQMSTPVIFFNSKEKRFSDSSLSLSPSSSTKLSTVSNSQSDLSIDHST